VYGGTQLKLSHSTVPSGQPHFLGGKPFYLAHLGGNSGRGGRRPTIDLEVFGRTINEATGFDKESMNMSMKIIVFTIGPNTDFK
jgi:hypothetical protein